MEPETVAAFRTDIPALAGSCYLNTGTLGPSPRSVTERLVELYCRWQEAGPGDPEVYRRAAGAATEAKEDIAAFFGVTGPELALTGNSTDGINLVAGGIEWRAGDEVVISDQEHPAGLLIWLHLRQTKGIRIRIARLSPESRVRNVEEVASLITPRTRLVAMSHVSCMTGLCLPAREITEVAHARSVPVLFDGAQAAGQLQVDFREIGCDYYALNGHKWLLGPIGTGALYVSPTALATLVPDRVGAGSAETWDYAEDGSLCFRAGGGRFEFGTRLYPLYQAWPLALAFLRRAGLRAVRERGLALAARLRLGLAALPGVGVVGPTGDPALMSALVTCRVSGLSGDMLYEELKSRFGVISRPVAEFGATRFSTAFFNTEEEIDLALRATATIAREVSA